MTARITPALTLSKRERWALVRSRAFWLQRQLPLPL